MEMDDPKIRELDSLIKEGLDIQRSEHPNPLWSSQGAVNSLRFTAWSTHAVQFFMDNIKGRNAYVDQFKAMKNASEKRHFPTTEDTHVGVRLLQDLLKYLFDNPSLESRHEVKHKHISKDRISPNRKIFIVHGQDEKIKSEVEEFLISINLEPIILHKQADLGKTIIEKVEHYSDVGFAVIILTKDDFGGALPSGQATTYDLFLFNCLINPKLLESISAKEREILKSQFFKWIDEISSLLKPRARQNVIFEFGYFIAKLGRGRVAALCESDIERPSDIDGLLYTPLDQKGDWKKKLAREINAAGITIDEKYLT